MRINKNGQRHRHEWNAQDFRHVPTSPAQLMAETCEAMLVKLEGIPGQRFARAYPVSPLADAVAALETLKRFCKERTGTPTK